MYKYAKSMTVMDARKLNVAEGRHYSLNLVVAQISIFEQLLSLEFKSLVVMYRPFLVENLVLDAIYVVIGGAFYLNSLASEKHDVDVKDILWVT